MEYNTVKKAWITGRDTMVITIPKDLLKVAKIEPGDYLKITLKKIENETTQILKKELPKTKFQEKPKEQNGGNVKWK